MRDYGMGTRIAASPPGTVLTSNNDGAILVHVHPRYAKATRWQLKVWQYGLFHAVANAARVELAARRERIFAEYRKESEKLCQKKS